MCRLKRWPPKNPQRNMHSQEPRASKSCSIWALIRAPKSCSIRVPDSGPEKSYTIRAPKEWLVDTNVQIETVASKEPLEKHAQPRAPGPEKLFDSGPDSGPEKLFHSGPGFGPRRVVYRSIRVPDLGPEKSYTIRAPKRWLVQWQRARTCGPAVGREVAEGGFNNSIAERSSGASGRHGWPCDVEGLRNT